MKIILDERAKKYLESNNIKVITVEVKGCNSWSGTILKPLASVGKPYNTQNYTIQNVDGIDVYVMNGLRSEDDVIEVSTFKFLFMENLVLKGIII